MGLIEIPTRAQVAVHEAGHAIAALSLGCVVEWVAIFENGNGGVVTRPHSPECAGIIAWAGVAADGGSMLHDEDAAGIKQLNEEHGFGHDKILQCREGARTLITAARPAVDALAKELDAKGRVTWATIRRIAIKASPELEATAAPARRRSKPAA
jgi:hypothetical protein